MVKRSDLISILAPMISEEMLVVTAIGNTARAWVATGRGDTSLTYASLGMCTPAALGLALALPHRKVVALDGDGNLILNLCSLATVANQNPSNLTIIVFDNRNYLSAGPGKGNPGMPTATAGKLNLEAVARGSGISKAVTVDTEEAFKQAVEKSLTEEGPSFIVARIETVDAKHQASGERFPAGDTRENKYSFARHIERLEKISIIKGGGG